MIPATAGWGQPQLRRLPRRIPPVHDETLESYIGRLAARNYLSRADLATHLTPRRQGSRRGVIASESLAAVTGFAEPRLAYALPEIRQRVPYCYAPPMIGQVVGSYPNRRHPLCRRCAGATGPVTIWARCDYNVCVRHQLWVGNGVSQSADQVDLADMPETVQAQVRLQRLIRRRGYPRVRYYFSDACAIEHWGSRNPFALTPRNERMRRLHAREHAEFLPLSYGYAAQYPEVVPILSVISSPYWRRMAKSLEITDRFRFYDEILKGRPAHPSRYSHGGLASWINHERQPTGPTDPDGERTLRRLYLGTAGVLQLYDPAADVSHRPQGAQA